MGAGPVPIPQAVAQANGVIINHLGPTMDRVIRNVKEMASYAFQTRSDKIIGLSGPASAAMEMAVSQPVLARAQGAVPQQRHVQRAARRDGVGRGRRGHLPRERRRAARRRWPQVREAFAKQSLRRGHDGARRDLVRREDGRAARDLQARQGARRAHHRRLGGHAHGDARAHGRVGHRRRPHGRTEGAQLDPGRVAVRVLGRRLARASSAPAAAPALVLRRDCARSGSGAPSSTTTRRPCRACSRCTRRCAWSPRRRSSGASGATR